MGLFDGLLRCGPKIDDRVRGLPSRPLIGISLKEAVSAPPPGEDFKTYLDREVAIAAKGQTFKPLIYRKGAFVLVPLFTDTSHIENWGNRRPEDWEKFIFLTACPVRQDWIRQFFESKRLDIFRIILGPSQPHERILTASEMSWLVEQPLDAADSPA